MPEGDTIYKLARRLEQVLDGHILRVGELRVPQHATADLSGHTVLEHDTHGKHLLTRFDSGLTLHSHLRMDGSWSTTGPGKTLPRAMQPDIRIAFETDHGFGVFGLSIPVVELVRTRDEAEVIGYLGPDPLRADWNLEEAVRRFTADVERPVVEVLLDQRVVAGFGNLWANELCFLRGHSPWTPVGDVPAEPLLRLGARALRHSALNPASYQITTGNRRRGQTHYVYGRRREGCYRCKGPIRRVDAAVNAPLQRLTYWCPACQPGPEPKR